MRKIDDEVYRLPCEHIFKKKYFNIWLKESCECPCCRTIVYV